MSDHLHKFKPGDRVRVIKVFPECFCDVGQVGTVMEDSCVPWVEFDTPTRQSTRTPPELVDDRFIYESNGETISCRWGYCDVVDEDHLELVEVTLQ